MDVALVCIMGVTTVFIGLLCIVLLCRVMSFFVSLSENAGAPQVKAKPAASSRSRSAASQNAGHIRSAVPPAAPVQSPDPGPRAEIIAAVTAAIAEESGEDFTAIRILSLKKI